jgi:hypothetical protein
MTTIALLATLAGAALGLRFRVFILFPAIALACLAIIATHLVGAIDWRNGGLAIGLAAVTLQLGYLAGITIRFVLAAVRMRLVRVAVVALRSPDTRSPAPR